MKRPLQTRQYKVDADRILPGLYQGSRPPAGHRISLAGFDALILCAEEYQPPAGAFPGVRVHHVPLDDHPYTISDQEWMNIIKAAEFAADNIHRWRRVLVTCQMGLNRSGIVTAVAVMMLTGLPSDEVVRHIRSQRRGALSNKSFARQLNILPA